VISHFRYLVVLILRNLQTIASKFLTLSLLSMSIDILIGTIYIFQSFLSSSYLYISNFFFAKYLTQHTSYSYIGFEYFPTIV
jgi:hypothetical protein